jgi:hypothetical protein
MNANGYRERMTPGPERTESHPSLLRWYLLGPFFWRLVVFSMSTIMMRIMGGSGLFRAWLSSLSSSLSYAYTDGSPLLADATVVVVLAADQLSPE